MRRRGYVLGLLRTRTTATAVTAIAAAIVPIRTGAEIFPTPKGEEFEEVTVTETVAGWDKEPLVPVIVTV